MWFHVGVLRSSVVKEVIGGFSCALRLLMRAFFLEADSFTNGILLALDTGPTLLFARLRIHLGDEAALSQGLSIKGASGIRPCLCCANVLKRDSGLAHRRPRDLVEVSCTDFSKFVRNTDRDIWQLYDGLVTMAAHSTRAEMDRRSKAKGMNINANGVIADLALRPHVGPVSTMTYDWQHTFLSNGVVSQEMFMFLEACRGEGLVNIYGLLEQFCQANWCFPQQNREKSFAIHKIFSKTREQASKEHWRSGASELLAAYPLVRRFAEALILQRLPQLRPQVLSLVSCFKVIDMIQDAKAGVTNSDAAALAVQKHLQQHVATYGDDESKPKTHYALHIPHQMSRDGMVFDCFVVGFCSQRSPSKTK